RCQARGVDNRETRGGLAVGEGGDEGFGGRGNPPPRGPLVGWRRLATQTWRAADDPSVYAALELPMRNALAYLERVREETGVRVTVTHLVARALALAMHRYPQLNGIVARGRILLPDSVDIFLHVATDGGMDLSGIKIERVDEKSAVG